LWALSAYGDIIGERDFGIIAKRATSNDYGLLRFIIKLRDLCFLFRDKRARTAFKSSLSPRALALDVFGGIGVGLRGFRCEFYAALRHGEQFSRRRCAAPGLHPRLLGSLVWRRCHVHRIGL
jgi:hypothetical protein